MRYLIRKFSILTCKAGLETMNVYSASNESVKHAVELLKSGRVVALPTDTIYGLAADAKCDSAILELYKIKERDLNQPNAICVGSVSDINKWGETDYLPCNLLESLLPGPVTVLLNKLDTLSIQLNPGVDKVGIRVPKSDFICKVATDLGSALVLTSANISKEQSTINVEEFKHLWKHLGGVFDAGSLGQSRAGSTIVDLSRPGEYCIVRSGSALKETIETVEKFGLKNTSS